MTELGEQGGGVEDLRRENVEWQEIGQAWLRRAEAAQLAVRIEAVQQIRAAMKRAIQRHERRAAPSRAARRARRTMTLLALERVSKSHWRGRHEIVVLDDVSLEVERRRAGRGLRAARRRQDDTAAHRGGHRSARRGVRPLRGARAAPPGRFRRLTGIHAGIGWVGRQGPFASGMRMLDHVALPLLRSVAADEARAARDEGAQARRRGRVRVATWTSCPTQSGRSSTIAHAIVRDPRLLLADDPTGGLGV